MQEMKMNFTESLSSF